MLFYENLEEIIFHRHEMFDVDEIIVLSGYLGPQPVSRLDTLPFKSSVIYGMYGSDNIGERLHTSLLNLNNKMDNTSILYSNMPIHSKCYVWKKNDKIVTALVGSANFSISGLSNPYKEVLAETTFDTFSPLNQYLIKIKENCIDCTTHMPSASKSKNIKKIAPTYFLANTWSASLLGADGEVPESSGLNWGLSKGHTTDGDAYIKITVSDIIAHPKLFPPTQSMKLNYNDGGKKTRKNDIIDIIWDDGTNMAGLLEGTQPVGGITYPKQISSSPRKNIIGAYIRERLGVSLKHKITRADLEEYGRTDILISLQGEGIYSFDFSV